MIFVVKHQQLESVFCHANKSLTIVNVQFSSVNDSEGVARHLSPDWFGDGNNYDNINTITGRPGGSLM